MVNNVLPANAEGMPEESFLSRMTRLYVELNTIGDRCGEMPDSAMDCITEAASIVRRAVIDKVAKSEGDIACKLRFAAILVENPHGVLCDEEEAAVNAVRDLVDFREDQRAEWRQESRHS